MHRLLLVIGLVACGTKASPPIVPPPPPDAGPDAPPIVGPDAAPVADGPLDRDLPRLALKSVALYEAVVAAFRSAGASCPAATKALTDLVSTYASVSRANAIVLHEGRARELKAALAKYDDKLDAAAKEIVGSQTMSKCTSDRAFTKAFDDLVGAPP